jgi:hypothetical protein
MPIGMGTLKETKLFIFINASVFCIQVVMINVEYVDYVYCKSFL